MLDYSCIQTLYDVYCTIFSDKGKFEKNSGMEYDKKLCNVVLKFLKHYQKNDNKNFFQFELENLEKIINKSLNSETFDIKLAEYDKNILKKLDKKELITLLKILDRNKIFFLAQKVSLYFVNKEVHKYHKFFKKFSPNLKLIILKSFEQERNNIDVVHQELIKSHLRCGKLAEEMAYSFINIKETVDNLLEENEKLRINNELLKKTSGIWNWEKKRKISEISDPGI